MPAAAWLRFRFERVLKLISPQRAAELLSQLSSLDGQTSKVLILVGSSLELIVGILLIIRTTYFAIAAFVSSVTLLLFTFVGLWALQNPRPCGCFGDVLEFRTDEYFIARNIILLFVSMFVFRDATKSIENATE